MTDSILRSYQYYSHTSMVPFPAPIAPFTTIDALPGVVLWLDANEDAYQDTYPTAPTTVCTNATNCCTWLDQISGYPLYGNLTTNPLGYRSAELNGLPTMRAGGNAGNRTHSSNMFTALSGADSYCFWFVGSFGNNAQSTGRIASLSTSSGGGPPFDNDTTAVLGLAFRQSGTAAITSAFNGVGDASIDQAITYSTAGTADAPFRYSSFGDGSTITTYLNNANPLSVAYGSTMSLSGSLFLGIMTAGWSDVTSGIGDNTAQAYVSEVIICNGHDAEAYRDDVDAYLFAKWGF